jgi:SAM-dependent methyltransferase
MMSLSWSRVTRRFLRFAGRKREFRSGDYWESRYAKGGDSGIGSYGKLAEFKANVINGVVVRNNVQSVIDLGCGDGNQLSYFRFARYIGVDVSQKSIEMCRERYGDDDSKSFHLYDSDRLRSEADTFRADMGLSLDVVYHLVEDEVFDRYMRDLFTVSTRLVVIYSSDTDENPPDHARHVRHRKFSAWIEANAPQWSLLEKIDNDFPYEEHGKGASFADFYVYQKS